MTWVVVGLGNPGEEYEGTRHNAGRMALERFAKDHDFAAWKQDKKAKATVSKGVIGKSLAVLLCPDTFMNKSGEAVAWYVKTPKAAEKLIVVYDDLDLPLGTMKLSYDRGSGGHKGLDSVMRAVRSRKFTRVRLGVSPASAAGKIKKPKGEDEVVEFILKRFKQSEIEILGDVFKKASDAIAATIAEGPMIAMNQYN